MKKRGAFYLFLVVIFAFILTGCDTEVEEVTKQTAAAKVVYAEDQNALMMVELTDGYSVEFATGAAYFYKGDKIEDSDIIAHAFVISKAEYDEEIGYFEDNTELEGTFDDLDNGTYSYTTDDSVEYFFSSNDDLYMKVVIGKEYIDDADSIYSRFSAETVD